MMTRKELVEFWQHEEHAVFEGWDFSYLDDRLIEESPPWSFEDLAKGLMANVTNMLDMGTGDGEKLIAMQDSWPETVVATEGYPPNVELALDNLNPLGVKVYEAPGEVEAKLPFLDDSFDLVINRHTGYGFFEIARNLYRCWCHRLLS